MRITQELLHKTARDAVKEMSIEYLADYALTPARRLVGVICLTAYSVHSKNSLETNMTSILEEKVNTNDAKLEKIDDL